MKKAILTTSLLVLGAAQIVSLASSSTDTLGNPLARASTLLRSPVSVESAAPRRTSEGTAPASRDTRPLQVLSEDEPPQQDDPRVAPEKLPLGTVCLECHADVSNQKNVHRPVRTGKCKLCHLQEDLQLHKFEPPEDLGKVCKECHALPERLSLHVPVRDGECLSCHLIHQSEERYLLRFDTEVEQCGQCHADQVGIEKRFIHGPVATGACSLCHLSHSSVEPKLLRSPEEQSCLVCHVAMVERLSPPNNVHAPVREDCAQCHDPHASDHRYQLKSETKQLCLDCHRPMIEELEAQPVYHEALRTEEGCAHCHAVHSSPYPKMLKQPVKQLCMSCHDKPIPRTDGTALPGMGKKLANSTHLHGPLAEGNCAACHDPHGAVTFSLLRDPYPKTFYAPWDSTAYSLCFRCHDAGAFSTEKTETLTGFRNGETNLHFLHVNDKKKGRTCRACHETHASNLPRHMTEGVPFGTWEIPINFQITSAGGSCASGCHAVKQYDRENPVPPPSKDLLPMSSNLPRKP